jgi:site-specific DNA-methyltransferase (adenine-specific)
LRLSNLKHYRYDVVWKKQQATNPFFCKKGIMRIHENISIFYKKQPVYNPQFSYGHKNYSAFESEESKIGEVYGASKSVHRECSDGSRYPTSVLQFNTERTKYHPTQKPVALLEYLIKTYTNEGDTVLDNCMGSGSTGVACLNTNRNFIGIELDENYFQIAKDRINSIRLPKN